MCIRDRTYSGSGYGAAARPRTRIPAARRAAAVASELATAAAIWPGRAASASMKSSAVLPVPTPIVAPVSTYSSAAFAEARFISSSVIVRTLLEADHRVRPGQYLPRPPRRQPHERRATGGAATSVSSHEHARLGY